MSFWAWYEAIGLLSFGIFIGFTFSSFIHREIFKMSKSIIHRGEK